MERHLIITYQLLGMTSLKKMVHSILIRMQDGNKKFSTIYLRVSVTNIIHFCAEMRENEFLLFDGAPSEVLR